MTRKFKSISSFSATAVLAATLVGGFAGNAMAAGAVEPAQEQAVERVPTRAQHKMANQFHRRQVLAGQAEFARLEIAPEAGEAPKRRVFVKSGNRFHPAN
jgi:hypothetical protein